jgi:hypothetical protein
MLAVRHPSSKSITNESHNILRALRKRKTVTRYPNLITYQTDYYNYYSMIKNISYNNVFDGALLLHNLQSKLSKQFRCMWYEQYQSWADRDQIPGPFAMINMMRLSRIKYPQQYYNNIDKNIFNEKLEYIPIGYNDILKKFEYIRILDNNNHWTLKHYNIAFEQREQFAF